ncbi:Terminal uridylyltransferase 7 [Seminavis robusta]|uniref:Speckle targeted PIP5K1A-regulated poly(A) polymerase n=1 Tax=Seminavis robusta TaxID=568900 RepID=A0A9N8DYE2_9STRA|nr:Terminal uridylyltransferase 7 [Seminavis robusta]|eukprot:Sro450_g145590.1 Terminal uridylyltransferase 7 (991) ;mRNA; r:39538-42605
MVMEESNPYERIEVRDDGFLWLVNYTEEDGGEEEHQQPLVLHAVASLLRQLKEPWHDSVQFTTTDPEAEEEEEEEENPPEEEEEELDDEEKEKGANEEEPKEKDTADDDKDDDGENDDEWAHLERTLNLRDRIMRALEHVRLYKHDNRKGKKSNGLARIESKVIALHHQRERLMQQKQQQQQQQDRDKATNDADKKLETTDADKTTQGETEAGFQVVPGKSGIKKDNNQQDDDASESSASQASLHPHVRTVRTINSIRALVPVLLRIISHPQRNNKEIKVGPKKLKLTAAGKGGKWFVLGGHVFDTATKKNWNSMHSQLQELMQLFLPTRVATEMFSNPLDDNYWDQNFWNKEWLAHAWVVSSQETTTTPSPIDIIIAALAQPDSTMELDESTRKQIAKSCRDCDDKLWPNFAGAAKEDDDDLAKQYEKAVENLHHRLGFILERDFPGARLSVYGSCLSNLTLEASDVDLSLYLPQAARAKKSFQNGFWPAEKYEKEMSKLVREVFRRLVRRKIEFQEMVPVTRARVPVVKGSYLKANNPYTPHGELHFDICFLNDIAVANSNLLREYSLMHESVRQLMIAVKAWAKEHNICSAQDNCLSSYAWMNMVVFYLQCIDFVPNLQCQTLAARVGIQRSTDNYWHNVNDLDTFYLTFEQAKLGWKRPEHFDEYPVSNVALLYGFFHFYACSFSRQFSMVSIKRGKDDIRPKTSFRKCSPFFVIEDPFETFASHCPHDLGIPVHESQCRRILSIIAMTEEHLGKIVGNNGGVSEGPLWPAKVPAKSKNKNGEAADGGGRNRKGKGGGGEGRQKGKHGKQPPQNQQNQAADTGGGGNEPKRSPDCTLKITKINRNVKESDLRVLFSPFASQTNSRVVSITVTTHGLAYVDFDSADPVIKALEQHSKEPFCLEGHALSVSQKPGKRAKKKNQKGKGSQNKQGNSHQEPGQSPKEVNEGEAEGAASESHNSNSRSNPRKNRGIRGRGGNKNQRGVEKS